MSATPGVGWTTTFQMKPNETLAVPAQLHRVSCEKLCDRMQEKLNVQAGLILLEGGVQENVYDTDGEPLFRQDSWFQYLFGVKEPSFFGAVTLGSKRVTLFMPRLPERYRVWCGKIYPPEYFKQLYGVDEVLYVDEMKTWLQASLAAITEETQRKIYLLEGLNSDSQLSKKGAKIPDEAEFTANIDRTELYPLLAWARMVKSPLELSLMQYCSYVSSKAHVEVMKGTKPGMMEYELEAQFLYEIYKKGGCRTVAYTSICACGPNSATLHYGHAAAPNSKLIEPKDMALLDMGAAYHGYMSDVTCSYPVSGKFTADQRVIYEAVLQAQITVMDMMKPGIPWPECHKASQREVLRGLLKAGVLENGTVEELEAAKLGPVFMPHGLGHLLGCDTHDVGGSYLRYAPPRPEEEGLQNLRTARVLEPGMVLTVEPGCYFIDVLLDKALATPEQAKYINASVLDRFRDFGGVRLEDDVVVLAETNEEGKNIDNYTLCPRTVEEVESVMAGGAWPPAVDALPQLRRRWVKLAADCRSMVPAPLSSSSSAAVAK